MHNLFGTNWLLTNLKKISNELEKEKFAIWCEEAWVNMGGWGPNEYRIEDWSLECVSGYNEQGV